MSPPEHGLVLWCNEKSQVGAGPHAARVAAKEGACHHDAGLQALWHDHAVCHAQRAGRASHRLAPAAPHLHRVAEVPAPDRSRNAGGLTLHLIADHYATHKHLAVQAWLAKPPRLNMYFTPPSASWLNMVERSFRDIITERRCRGVPELVAPSMSSSPITTPTPTVHLDQEPTRHPTEGHSPE
jgi:hypothetical protein